MGCATSCDVIDPKLTHHNYGYQMVKDPDIDFDQNKDLFNVDESYFDFFDDYDYSDLITIEKNEYIIVGRNNCRTRFKFNGPDVCFLFEDDIIYNE